MRSGCWPVLLTLRPLLSHQETRPGPSESQGASTFRPRPPAPCSRGSHQGHKELDGAGPRHWGAVSSLYTCSSAPSARGACLLSLLSFWPPGHRSQAGHAP